MKHIELTQGRVAIVDDADYDGLAQYKWCVMKTTRGYWYAARRDYTNGYPGAMIYMHRVIAGAEGRVEVHHSNANTLDNRRENLVALTRKQHYAIHGNGYHPHKTPKPRKQPGYNMNGDLNTEGVAVLVGLTRQRVHQIARKRNIGHMVGKFWHFTPQDIEVIQFVRGVVQVQQEA